MCVQESDMLSFINAQELPVMLLDLLEIAEVGCIILNWKCQNVEICK